MPRLTHRVARLEHSAAMVAAARSLDPQRIRWEQGKRATRLLMACPAAWRLAIEVGEAHDAHKRALGGKEDDWLQTDPWALAMMAEADRLTMSVPNRAAILAGEAYE